MSRVMTIPAGTRGFDCNTVVQAAHAKAMKAAGYQFAVRYVPRIRQALNDVTASEVQTLHLAGLAVMLVQHVESDSRWVPDTAKGEAYGQTAALSATAAGYPKGATLWLDLEGVAVGTSPTIVDAYCRAWFAAVAAKGFQPGLYVGWHCGLTPKQLYALPFTRYWGAYNLNADEAPAVRGICMKQGTGKPPAGVPFAIDTNMVRVDERGGLPSAFVPDEWGVL